MLAAYYNPIFKSNTFRKLILFCASIGLYSFCEPNYAVLLIGLIAANILFVKLSVFFHTKAFRVLAIAGDAGVLLFFKYINVFRPDLLNDNASQFILPIGLSYFIFKCISYVVDSKDKKNGGIIDAAIYIANFLTIISGPLSTYSDELPFIREKKTASLESIYNGMERLIVGLAKKIILADSLNSLVMYCFGTSELSVVMAWTGAIAYTLQLYFDFSGYTDMVIGIGYLFGFQLPENFDSPYMAVSISDFWKRWHISLTKWFTKYIYYPLGGSRTNSAARHIFNLFVVWLVTGLWHGSNMTFLVWAMVYFVLQTLEKYTGIVKLVTRFHLGHLYTMLIVIIEWVIFKSKSVGAAWNYIKSMFFLNSCAFRLVDDFSMVAEYMIPLALGLLFASNIGKKAKSVIIKSSLLSGIYNLGLLSLFVISFFIIISQGISAPLYAGF